MKSFAQFTEAASKNSNMRHLEDALLLDNEGANQISQTIDDLVGKLSGESGGGKQINVTVKWDGNPAVFFGKNPENGQFFVGTKSVFSKSPRIVYNKSDLAEFYSDNPGLSKILEQCLKLLPKIYPGAGIYQGDLMFSAEQPKKNTTVKGEQVIEFRPNTIAYVVGKTQKDLFKRIDNAKLGIVIHTVYSGTEMSNLSMSFNVSADNFKSSRDVWIDDANFKAMDANALLPKSDVKILDAIVKVIKSNDSTVKKLKADKDAKAARIFAHLNTFAVRTQTTTPERLNLKDYTKDFTQWSVDTITADAAKLKSERGREKKLATIETFKTVISSKSGKALLVSYLAAIKAKNIILMTLNKVGNIKTFVRTPEGFKITQHEGFVAITDGAGVFKLVDRLESTRNNRNRY